MDGFDVGFERVHCGRRRRWVQCVDDIMPSGVAMRTNAGRQRIRGMNEECESSMEWIVIGCKL